jgi:N-acetylglucosaminyl-diphospho-decaprenol L-rhamnosyltransferase
VSATITAVVLNWRTPELTLRASHALLDDGLPPGRLVIVDNGSGDGSVEQLTAGLPGSHVLALDANLGFARANNLGAAALPASRAYLLVNSDAFVNAHGSVGHLLDALDDPAVGIAVPRLRNEDLSLQPSVYPLSTPLPELIRAAGLSRFVPGRWAPALGAHWDHGASRPVQCAVGAVLCVRALAWEQLGGFDTRRFMYAEDLDLFWRARALGWGARFVAESEFVHLGGASSSTRWANPQRAERVAAAEAEMLRANLGRRRAALTIGVMAAGVSARSVVHRLRGNAVAAEEQRAWARGYLRGRPPDST